MINEVNEISVRVPDVQLLISSIELKDLKNTGSVVDPQDPCVHLHVGEAVYKSARKTDAGTSATFDEEVLMDITDSEAAGMMVIDVFNEHVTGTKKHVGVGSVLLPTVLPSKNTVTTFVVPLIYKAKGKETQRGTATITAQIVDNRSSFWPVILGGSPEADTRVPDVQLMVSLIELKDLKNTGSVVDPQDPCVHLHVGEAVYKSARKTDAGTSATFDEEVLMDITDSEAAGMMVIDVFNEHVTGTKKHVGVGSVLLPTVLPSKNTVTTFVVPLIYKAKGKETQRGTATITAQIVDNRSIFFECGCPMS